MKGKILVLHILLIGAVTWAATETDGIYQSESATPDHLPITVDNSNEGKREETPEVVLQIKYDGGELNKIYLAQYRKGPSQFLPSVNARNSLCSDLCYGGLGGEPCGSTCHGLLPVGLNTMLHDHSTNSTELESVSSEQVLGEPRTSVCPTLCANMLGDPLCNCEALHVQIVDHVDWGQICSAFCDADRYVLGGCPACDAVHVAPNSKMMRVLTTNEGWTAWCNVQCRQGSGGAACNCDRAPFQ